MSFLWRDIHTVFVLLEQSSNFSHWSKQFACIPSSTQDICLLLLLKTVVNCNVASASVSLHMFSFMALYTFVFNFNLTFNALCMSRCVTGCPKCQLDRGHVVVVRCPLRVRSTAVSVPTAPMVVLWNRRMMAGGRMCRVHCGFRRWVLAACWSVSLSLVWRRWQLLAGSCSVPSVGAEVEVYLRICLYVFE